MTQDSLGVSRERPYEDDIMLIDSYEIINVVRKALSFIDPRLIDHGERVAFITRQIIEIDPSGCGVDPGYLFVLSALHDVGAYKTDEIDDMVSFDSHNPFRHAVYGYLFLHNTTMLGDYAKAVLYHHSDYSSSAAAGVYAPYARLIYLADRIDILAANNNETDFHELRGLAGTRFDPEYTELFFQSGGGTRNSGSDELR